MRSKKGVMIYCDANNICQLTVHFEQKKTQQLCLNLACAIKTTDVNAVFIKEAKQVKNTH